MARKPTRKTPISLEEAKRVRELVLVNEFSFRYALCVVIDRFNEHYVNEFKENYPAIFDEIKSVRKEVKKNKRYVKL